MRVIPNALIATAGIAGSLLCYGIVDGRAELPEINDKYYRGGMVAQGHAHCIASHRVGKIVLAVNNNGTLGTGFRQAGAGDCFTGGEVRSCEYPKGSRVEYLFAGAFWIGAVVGRDTLVSLGADGWSFHREFRPDASPFGDMVYRSIINPAHPRFEGAISEEDYISVYTDTFTRGVEPDYLGQPHRPLFIEVTDASYAWSYAYAEDLVLFDYKIRNIGSARLDDVYMGLYIDGDVCDDCQGSGGYSDDITGFLQTVETEFRGCTFMDTVNTAWLADNEGDLANTGELKPAEHVSAMRIIRTPAQELDVSYNWWISSGASNLDFGPREKGGVGRWKEDFRDYRTGGLGTPEGDVNKYYIMRNREFDYDQARVASIQPGDPLWLYPTQDYVDAWARGLDTRYLLSFGPFTIDPGQTLPLSFAYLAGENLHSVQGNLENLPHDPDAFYRNLDFSDLGLNGRWASWIYDNPGVDTDDDGYAGEFRICVTDSTPFDSTMMIDSLVVPPETTWTYDYRALTADTLWYLGDGIPDFRGASPPPAPTVWLTPEDERIRVRFNGMLSETTRDIFSRERDFEGYRIYIARDERPNSFSVLASYDLEDYNKYTFNSSRGMWVLLDDPFSLDELRTLYGDSTFDPLNYTQSHPFTHPRFPDSVFYFEAQDFNVSDLNRPDGIRKIYPDQPFPGTLIPDSARAGELTEDGYFKYFEYEYVTPPLLSTVDWWINVTAFDYGSPESGLPPLETSPSVGAKSAFPQPSVDDVARENLRVYVYPNPYRIDADYRGLGFEGRADRDRPENRVREIHFANLPAKCMIRIYSIDGDLVKEIYHDKDPSDPRASHDSWDLITRNTQMVVSGLYYWSVEPEQGEVQIGKLAIIM